jgi:membrane protein insertase, yidC/oxa1 family
MNFLLTKYNGAILGPIAKVLGYILEGIYAFFDLFGIHNTGLCIIVFTFIINGLMIPITIKQQKFSKLNSVMAPEIQAIQAKYKDKKDQDSVRKMQAEQQTVYQKYGVSATAGCLPMLITLPIFFALYRVIYNVPAYVPQIKEIYTNIIDAVESSGMALSDFAHNLGAFVKNGGVTDITINSPLITSQSLSKVDDIVAAISTLNQDNTFTTAASNYIVDILSQFKDANWKELWDMNIFKNYPAVTDSMKTYYGELKGIYNFCGMNIMENATWKNFTISIPILAVVTQFINNKIITGSNKKDKNNQDPTAASMNTMNNIMPFMSGIFCFMFPIGVGLYWVAGNVFRIIQGLFINAYFKKVGIESIAEKNIEKRNKKLAKKGIDVNSTKMQQVAKTRTSSINTYASTNTAKKETKNNSSHRTSSKQDLYVNHNIKNGSISDFANMLNRDYESNANDSDGDNQEV